MRKPPRDPAFDNTFALLRDPYRFISKRCQHLESDWFETRLLLRPAVCMRGAEAARLFYDPRRFTRLHAAPEPLQATLFGKGGVQSMDGQAHQNRKMMFLSLLTEQRIAELVSEVRRSWTEAIALWPLRSHVVLYEEVQLLLTKAVCRWAEVPVPEHEITLRTGQLVSLFDDAASFRHLRSRIQRSRAEKWLAGLIESERAAGLRTKRDSALATIAHYRDETGTLLPIHVAAVELLNVLRPTVAVSVYVVFVAHAMHQHPECALQLRRGDANYLEWFVQEVRRFYPFFPVVAARPRDQFEWQGLWFQTSQLVLLDLYGTNHHAAAWDEPDAFLPERFHGRAPSLFNFIPQGGGDVRTDHRCPGEGVALALMKASAEILARDVQFSVPAQDLRIDFTRMPALPRSRFIIAAPK